MAGLIQDVKLFGENIPWLQNLREKGLQAFENQGIPTAKTEAWKYTKPRDLNAEDFEMLPSNFIAEIQVGMEDAHTCHHEDHECHCVEHHCGHDGCEHTCHEHSCHGEEEGGCCCGCGGHNENTEGGLYLDLPFDGYQLHFINGQFVPLHPALPRGVEIMTLMEAVLIEEAKPYIGKLADINKYPFAALNTAYMEEGLFINIQKGIKLEKPIIFVNHSFNEERNLFFNIRNVIVVENGAEAEFIECHNYTGPEKSRYFSNMVNEIYVERNASFKHYKLQDEAFKANHVALNAVKVKEGGNYTSFCLQRGANIGRNETNVALVEENAHAEVNAAYIMHGWATLDTTTDIEHLSPYTFSDQLVKGVVGGDAKGVFQGKIHIAKHAVKTEGKQLHKALLLTDTAEIDVKPELEIFADDVKCSHGAASGELDENQLFYMQSRGIGLEEAKQILIDAYLDDVIGKIPNAQVRDWMKSFIK